MTHRRQVLNRIRYHHHLERARSVEMWRWEIFSRALRAATRPAEEA